MQRGAGPTASDRHPLFNSKRHQGLVIPQPQIAVENRDLTVSGLQSSLSLLLTLLNAGSEFSEIK